MLNWILRHWPVPAWRFQAAMKWVNAYEQAHAVILDAMRERGEALAELELRSKRLQGCLEKSEREVLKWKDRCIIQSTDLYYTVVGTLKLDFGIAEDDAKQLADHHAEVLIKSSVGGGPLTYGKVRSICLTIIQKEQQEPSDPGCSSILTAGD